MSDAPTSPRGSSAAHGRLSARPRQASASPKRRRSPPQLPASVVLRLAAFEPKSGAAFRRGQGFGAVDAAREVRRVASQLAARWCRCGLAVSAVSAPESAFLLAGSLVEDPSSSVTLNVAPTVAADVAAPFCARFCRGRTGMNLDLLRCLAREAFRGLLAARIPELLDFTRPFFRGRYPAHVDVTFIGASKFEVHLSMFPKDRNASVSTMHKHWGGPERSVSLHLDSEEASVDDVEDAAAIVATLVKEPKSIEVHFIHATGTSHAVDADVVRLFGVELQAKDWVFQASEEVKFWIWHSAAQEETRGAKAMQWLSSALLGGAHREDPYSDAEDW